jgi:hypothetical protein
VRVPAWPWRFFEEAALDARLEDYSVPFLHRQVGLWITTFLPDNNNPKRPSSPFQVIVIPDMGLLVLIKCPVV